MLLAEWGKAETSAKLAMVFSPPALDVDLAVMMTGAHRPDGHRDGVWT